MLNILCQLGKFSASTSISVIYYSSSSALFLEKPSSWMTVDTALFIVSAGETKEEATLVSFTESKDKEVCLCELNPCL